MVPFVKNDGADIVLESLLQRAFIKSKAIDVEALCIYTGKRVWRLKVAASRCLPLPAAASRCLPLPPAACRRLPPHLLSSLFSDHALLQVDIRVLENDGNCSDAVITAAAAALKTFKRPDCLVVDGSVTVAAAADVSLTLHALPVSVTFAIFQLANGEQVCRPVAVRAAFD